MSPPDAPDPSDRPPTQTELEHREGQRQARLRAARLGLRTGTNGSSAAGPSPFGASEPIDTGIAAAGGWLQSCNSSPADQRAPKDGITLPNFDHATALGFYEAVRPSAFILGYTDGRSVSTADQFKLLAQEADRTHAHLFFPVATLKPQWADANTHEKGKVTTPSKDTAFSMPDGSTTHVLECPHLWGDCDAAKYEGNDPDEAKAHYEREGIRIEQQVDLGLQRLGITPFAKWRSGAGWQFLIKLDRQIDPDEAEIVEIKTVDEYVDRSYRVILGHVVIERRRKQSALPPIQSLNKALHQIPRNSLGIVSRESPPTERFHTAWAQSGQTERLRRSL